MLPGQDICICEKAYFNLRTVDLCSPLSTQPQKNKKIKGKNPPRGVNFYDHTDFSIETDGKGSAINPPRLPFFRQIKMFYSSFLINSHK